MDPIITAKNLNFVYNRGKDNEFQALTNISIDIYPEEFLIVFGPSGCGKSTLLNVFAGLELPDSGSITALGLDLMHLNKDDFAWFHRNQVGMIYQSYNLITSLSVLDNVALPQIFVNIKKRKREKWSMSLLERFDILEHSKKIPTELSGGQQQRIGIARSIVNNPKIVLADEPVGNLDSVSAKNVFDILEELNKKEKKTIILVTHNPEYLDYGNRIIYMKDGIITREVVNREKYKKKKKEGLDIKTPSTEISDLMRAYRGLSPEQINILIMPYKAKVFAHHFITSRNMEETKTFEESIQRRLLGTISQEELYDILNRPALDGGVGFDRRSADKILRRINRIIRMAYYIYQKGRQRKDSGGGHLKISSEEKAKKLTRYLLLTCYNEFYKNLDDEQLERLEKAVGDRVLGNIQKNGFFSFLDKPFKKGGVGLNSKTAKAITEEIELILILGFGIVEMNFRSKHNLDSDVARPEIPGSSTSSAQVDSGDISSLTSNLVKNITKEVQPETDKSAEKHEEAFDNNASKEKIEVNSSEELRKQVETIVDAIHDMGMKDFANIMSQTKARVKTTLDDAKIGDIVKDVIISRNR